MKFAMLLRIILRNTLRMLQLTVDRNEILKFENVFCLATSLTK